MKMTPGKWLLYWSLIYIGFAAYFWPADKDYIFEIQAVWIAILAAPIFIPTLAHWIHLKPIWDHK
jgi:hypothetical protein